MKPLTKELQKEENIVDFFKVSNNRSQNVLIIESCSPIALAQLSYGRSAETKSETVCRN